MLYERLLRDRQRFCGRTQWLIFRCLPALLCLVLVMLLLGTAGARAGQLDNAGVSAGQLELTDPVGSKSLALLHRSEVSVDISGMVAVVRLQQFFANTSPEWVEGVYAFPLPPNAAVRRMVLDLGERRIVGEIRERVAAEAAYTKARNAGKKASLVNQQRPNLFTSRVANIAPGESVSVVLEYLQPVDYRGGRFSLRLPTTITPRYIPGITAAAVDGGSYGVAPAHGWSGPTDQVPDAERITPLQLAVQGADSRPLNPLKLTVRLDAGMELASVDSPYHRVVLTRDEGRYLLRLADDVVEMNRDFVLNWQSMAGNEPAAALFTEQVDGTFYGMLMLLPPLADSAPRVSPRDIIMVIDTSGSMDGAPIRQARASLRAALQRLGPQDRFNIIAFNSDYRALFSQARPASAHHVQRAQEFVRHLDASGGTEMLPALQAALAPDDELSENEAPGRLRQVIFITDGAVGNEAALYKEIVSGLGSSRLFTVGIGAAPNSFFMRKAADYGRGSFTYIADVDEVQKRVSALFERLAAPVAMDISVTWPAGSEVWPRRAPDLYLGEPLMLAVKFGAQLPIEPLVISGQIAGRPWHSSIELEQPLTDDAAVSHPGVATLWARSKIAQLLGERQKGDSSGSLRDRVLPVALRHQLLSPYTSFLAVEEVTVRTQDTPQRSVPVPNSRPLGQGAQPYAYSQTATTARANVWLAALLLLIAVLVRAVRQRDHD